MVGVIIQARVNSTRLPAKVLKKVLGKTLLEFELERVKRASTVDSIIVATTDNQTDEVIEKLVSSLGFKVFRGSEIDVLDRYYEAAEFSGIKTIVRITGDCPLIDPGVIDDVVNFYKNGDFDYVTNGINSNFPDGMDVEVFSFEALRKAWEEAKLPSEREHVTAYIWKNPSLFKLGTFKGNKNYSAYRLTVDEPKDFSLVSQVISQLYPENPDFSLEDIISYLEKNPEGAAVNSQFARNEGLIKSIKEEQDQTKVEGERIYLRLLTPSDATSEYAGWLNDPKVNEFLETKKATIGGLREYVEGKRTDPKVVFWGIFDSKSDKHIGNIKLEPVDLSEGVAVLGILIGDKDYWGMGIATEAINLACEWAAKNLRLKTMTLGVYSAHVGAIKAYEKAGFKVFKDKGADGVWMKRELA